MAKTNIAEIFKDLPVSDSGTTGTEQIEYLDIDTLHEDERNFYALTGVDELASNILLMGLMDPLRVRDSDDGVVVVSGHRRLAAMRKLVEEGHESFRSVPCIRDRSNESAAMQELRLIYANNDTRDLCSADISKQAERVEALLYQLKEEGYDFPGRMRDHVAEACKISKSKLARLKVIRENLFPCWQPAYEKGDLPESTAYELSKLEPHYQRIIYDEKYKGGKQSCRYFYATEVECYGKRFKQLEDKACSHVPGLAACINTENFRKRAMSTSTWGVFDCPNKCCATCADLAHCSYVCPHLSDKAKQLKADARAEKKREKDLQAEKDAPMIEQIKAIWQRFGEARKLANKSVEQVRKAQNVFYSSSDDKTFKKLESGKEKIVIGTHLPFGYSNDLYNANYYIRAADCLGVSIDYLLCRTDVPEVNRGAASETVSAGWKCGDSHPEAYTRVMALVQIGPGKSVPMRAVFWTGTQWMSGKGSNVMVLDPDTTPVAWWIEMPKEDE